MTFVNSNGVRIYYEAIGQGTPLVLHHATAGSGADYIDLGFVDALQNDHRLILIDSRGHGKSDKPHDPDAYNLSSRALDVVAVLNELAVSRTDYYGYSLGGWIGFGLAKFSADKFNSFMLGGVHSYAENVQNIRDLMQNQDPFVTFIAQLSDMPKTMRSRHIANDLTALRILTQDRESNADALLSMTMPCMLFAGELDPRLGQVKECAERLPRANFFMLQGCGHTAAIFRSDLIIPHVKSFLRENGLRR